MWPHAAYNLLASPLQREKKREAMAFFHFLPKPHSEGKLGGLTFKEMPLFPFLFSIIFLPLEQLDVASELSAD